MPRLRFRRVKDCSICLMTVIAVAGVPIVASLALLYWI